MNCRRARHLVTRGDGTAPTLNRHLAACAECRHFAERWSVMQRELKEHRSPARPDAGFAGRVTARLEARADPLTWATQRLLPATLALTLVLAGWCLLWTPTPASLAEELGDGDLISWMLEAGEPGS